MGETESAAHMLVAEGGPVTATCGVEVVAVDGKGMCCTVVGPVAAGQKLFEERAIDVVENCLETERRGEVTMWCLKNDLECAYDMDVVIDHFLRLSGKALAHMARGFESHVCEEGFASQKASIAAFAVTLGRVAPDRQEELARYLRIVAINAHQFRARSGIALFDTFSKAAHSCEPNAAFSIRPDAIVEVRALHDISAGSLVTISYLSPLQLLAPTFHRRHLLNLQKLFLCSCQRCLRPDTSRIVRCQTCPGFRLRTESGTWLCSSCAESVVDKCVNLEEEKALLDLAFEIESSGVTSLPSLWSLRASCIENLGERHFVCFLVTLQLFKEHISADRLGVLDHGSGVMGAEVFPDLRERLLLPAILLFRRLERWVEDYAHCNRHTLFSLGVYELVNVLSERDFPGDAARICAKYLPLLQAYFGSDDSGANTFQELMEKAPRCAASLEGDCLRPGCHEPPTLFCSRCSLAHYCGATCAESDRYRHANFCLTADGFPQQAGYNPAADVDRSPTSYGKLRWNPESHLGRQMRKRGPY